MIKVEIQCNAGEDEDYGGFGREDLLNHSIPAKGEMVNFSSPRRSPYPSHRPVSAVLEAYEILHLSADRL